MKEKHFFLPVIIFVLLISLSVTQQASAQTSLPNVPINPPTAEVVSGEIIVKYKDGQTPEDLQKAVERRKQNEKVPFVGKLRNYIEDFRARQRGDKPPEEKLQQQKNVEQQVKVVEKDEITPKDQTLAEKENLDDIQFIKTSSQISSQTLEKLYESLPQVEYAEPNYIFKTSAVQPDDVYYPRMWNLTKIKMPEAWDITKGSSSITVAVIDTGIDYSHIDLSDNIIAGRDFGDNDNDPMDQLAHGTHVAGTIGALTNNNIGISGLNWNIKLMPLKVFDTQGRSSTQFMYEAIIYAADNGVKVINISMGANTSCVNTQSLQSAIFYARNKGVTVVAAAGNDDIIAGAVTPASCSGVIAVGALASNDNRSSYSNFGSAVDIAAPGGGNCSSTSSQYTCGIFSTIPSNSFSLASGTSMASPHVAGAAALLLSLNPNLHPDTIENYLKTGADPITTDKPIGNRLNVYNSLLLVQGQSLPPTATPTITPTLSPTLPPFPTSSPVTNNKINWQTPHVALEADNFYISIDGNNYLGNVPNATATSDASLLPLSIDIKVRWQEHGRDMQLQIFFSKAGTNWNVTEIRTLDGTQLNSVIGYPGFSGTALGSVLTIPSKTIRPYPNFPQNASITFENLRLQPFLNPQTTPTITPTPHLLAEDINHDGKIDLSDFTIWKCEFLGNGVCNNPPSQKTADINGDGKIDILDYGRWRNYF